MSPSSRISVGALLTTVLACGCFEDYIATGGYTPSPETLGESYELEVFFWNEVETADSYTFYWYVDNDSTECSKSPGDYERIENVTAAMDGVELIDCQEILEPANYGMSGPSPTGQCVTFRFDAGPWGCGDFICYDVYSDDLKQEGDKFEEHFGDRSQGFTLPYC